MNTNKTSTFTSSTNEDECTDRAYNHWWHKQEFGHSQPPVNVYEDKDEYLIEVAVPGFEKEDFHLSIKGNSLIIKGAKEVEGNSSEKEVLIKEFSYSAFHRVFSILQPVDTSEIRVNYRRGILSVTLPKKESDSEEYAQDLEIM